MGGMVLRQTTGYDANLNYQSFERSAGGSDSERKLQAIQLPDLTGKRFLDLGCNAGFFCAYAKNRRADYVLGVDNSPTLIGVARNRHSEVDFLDTGWDRFPEGEFDVVICLSAIHYASNQLRLAKDIWTHLSAAGLFVLEGGLIGDDLLEWTDLPVVAFREVGDRVRHMSVNFLRHHMLADFDWKVIGPSIVQGGDPIPRFVVHAHKKTAGSSLPDSGFRLCPVEYARALALCAPTIQQSQPSFAYVKALGALPAPATPERIEQVLRDEAAMACFADDIAYALSNYDNRLAVKATLSGDAMARLAETLQAKGIEVFLSSAKVPSDHDGGPLVMRRMEAGVEFSREGASEGQLAEILELCELRDAKVADLSGPASGLWRHLIRRGVQECHVIAPAGTYSPDSHLTAHACMPWELSPDNLDFVFFDATVADGFDHVDDVARLADSLKARLAPEGLAYLALRTGVALTDWDVFNPILLTPTGRLPSSDYLFNVLLRDFAVRPLIRLTDKANGAYSVTRIFRVAPRRPTLLVVLGPSQSGKTTLARSLRRIPDGVHLSNDYLFYELFRFKSKHALPNCSQRLIDAIDGGSAEQVGNFFRTIEGDTRLFEDYMRVILGMIPKGRDAVSLDLDLRQPERLGELRGFFAKAGFSVWIVTR